LAYIFKAAVKIKSLQVSKTVKHTAHPSLVL